ncbi:HTH domain-containing protein [Paenibacillus jiagnxiensis]|uniref:HTH domain-containing protein n=1 Tax=Paenibacillus jiagnxiensis TaxID=3228926 RepID=UPI0033A476F4
MNLQYFPQGLAEVLGVSVRTIYRDMQALSEAGKSRIKTFSYEFSSRIKEYPNHVSSIMGTLPLALVSVALMDRGDSVLHTRSLSP